MFCCFVFVTVMCFVVNILIKSILVLLFLKKIKIKKKTRKIKMDIVTKSEKIYAMVTVSRTWFNLWIDWGYRSLSLASSLAEHRAGCMW